jgi:hypothetical protein
MVVPWSPVFGSTQFTVVVNPPTWTCMLETLAAEQEKLAVVNDQ